MATGLAEEEREGVAGKAEQLQTLETNETIHLNLIFHNAIPPPPPADSRLTQRARAKGHKVRGGLWNALWRGGAGPRRTVHVPGTPE
ncbi:hypothetical protein GDO78_006788 [Eleutherodactylus coqui]|uniref:Uncharacterized protein n=1 Tax=Eleutherodactylus coqui TaxID=57060 RepID=A0A8J6FF46_ELECQ|nr:hypothetical protein GDO78_006788 [Eleutherodactylus coqui]